MIIVAIIVSIALGYKTGINTGLFAIAFAYLIGCFGLNLDPSTVISLWPLHIFFIIFSVSIFYNFAIANGTLEKLAGHLILRCQKHPHSLPFAVFFSAALIAGMGPGFYTVLAFMAPLTLLLCDKTGMSRILGAMAVNYGALAGANLMTSQSGIIFRELMQSAGVAPEAAFVNATGIFVATLIIPVVVITGFIVLFKHKSRLIFEADKPDPFDDKQKTTLFLVAAMLGIVLLVPVLHMLVPGNPSITFIYSKIDIGLVAAIFSVIALLLNLADEKKVISMVPWNTLIMICGVGMLISVAIEAGSIEILSSWIGSHLPAATIPLAMCLIAAIMSLFSSTLGVVTPALFPIVPAIAASSGHSAMLLFVSIVIGAQASAISPFSSGGSLILGASTSEEGRARLFPQLLFKAVPIGWLMAIAATLVLSRLG